MKKKCLIISGGAFSPLPFLYKETIDREEKEKTDKSIFVIACDSGYQNAKKMGIRPDLIVGDFDSAPCPDTDIPISKYPTRKDDTDTMLAIRHAMDAGYKDITIICALGGRLDHAYANIQAAAFVAANGGICRILEDTEKITVFNGREIFPKRNGYSLSVFSLTDKAEGVTIKGTKYEVENADMNNVYPIGTSNVWVKNEAEIYVKTGILVVIESKLKKGEHI